MTDQNVGAPAASQRRFSPLAITIVIVVLLILGFLAVASVLTEVLWFQQVGYFPVLMTQWLAAGAMFLIGFFGMAVPVFLAIDIAYRKRPVYARLTAQLDRYQELFEPLRRLVKWALPAVIGLFGGVSAASSWQQVLLWLNSSPTGKTDAQFGIDVSFYLFNLPMLQGIAAFASAVTLVAFIAGVATSYLYGGISFSGRDVRVSKSTRIQAAILATVYLLLQAGSLWLDQYSKMNDPSGLHTGPMFQDVHAVIPGKQILAGIALIVAVLFLVTAFTGKWRLPVIGTALFIVSSIVLGAGYPWAVQQFQVKPDEKSLESEYIARNIEATRDAYGVNDVQVERYDAVTTAEKGALRDDAVATSNIRIMDPEVISRTFSQLEQSKQYYQFPNSLNVDRYEIDGKVEDTVSAVRDIDIRNQDGWYNRTLVYTHGYGLVAAYGNQRSPSGEPVFLEGGIPTTGRLGKFEPRVYFGMASPNYSIVGGKRDKSIEVDYPTDAESKAEVTAEDAAKNDAAAEPAEGKEASGGDGNKDADTAKSAEGDEISGERQNLTTFKGDGGPKLNNIFTKLIYALKFQDMEVLLSGAVVDGSQVLYDRNPLDRVQKVAPYLTLDKSPYASVVDGRIVWIVDGYTTSTNYPYSEQKDMNEALVDAENPRDSLLTKPINYIRNSVKATVDAYDGKVTLYAWDTEDPLLKAWGKVFPDTLKSASEMSGDLLSHVRYPTDLFKVQREILGKYHVTDAGAFYSKEDAWRTPSDPVKTVSEGVTPPAQPPYYLTLSPGDNVDPNYSIYSTYIPDATGENTREILTGYLAANSNAGSAAGKVSKNYGELKLLVLPKGDTIPAPGQVQNSFRSNPKVSTELNLLKTGDSSVINGNLLTLPVGGGLLYVQPVYIEAAKGTRIPRLQKVLVSFGEDIAFEDTLDEALDDLFGGTSGASAGDGGTVTVAPGGDNKKSESTGKGAETTPKADPTLKEALKEMKSAIEDREQAMKDGDWAAYGKADKRLEEAVDAALKAE